MISLTSLARVIMVIMTLLTTSSAVASSRMVKVTVISITSYQYLMVIPGYEAGVEFVNQRYNASMNFQHVLIFNKSIYSCDVIADYSVEFASNFYYLQKTSPNNLFIFSAPMCSGELLLLAPVVREWNVPIVSIVGTSPTISNRKKYTTVLTTAPLNNSVLTQFLKKFFLTFGWSNVFLLCDDNNIVAYYKANCAFIQSELKRPQFSVNVLNYDSRVGPVDYNFLLNHAGQAARVIVILARSEVTRNFMIHAYQQNMTGGDYVYFYVEPHSLSNLPEWPNLKWRMGDANDQVARLAMSSLLVITFDNGPNIDAMPAASADFIKRRTVERYNFTVLPNQKVSAIAVAAFDTVTMFAQVVNEWLTLDPAADISNGDLFVQKFLNRTFILPTGQIYITFGGERFPDILVSQLNAITHLFEAIVKYTARTSELSKPFNRDLVWLAGKSPANEPYCGYTGTKLICLQDGKMSKATLAGLLSAILLSLILIVLATVLIYRCLMYKWSLLDRWWMLDHPLCTTDTSRSRALLRCQSLIEKYGQNALNVTDTNYQNYCM